MLQNPPPRLKPVLAVHFSSSHVISTHKHVGTEIETHTTLTRRQVVSVAATDTVRVPNVGFSGVVTDVAISKGTAMADDTHTV